MQGISFNDPEVFVSASAGRPGTIGSEMSDGDIERMLLEARRLVETAVDRHRTEGRLLTALEPDEGTETAERVVGSAARSLAVALSGHHDEGTARLVAALGRAAARGVDVRLLARTEVLGNRLLLERLDKYAPAVEVRLTARPSRTPSSRTAWPAWSGRAPRGPPARPS